MPVLAMAPDNQLDLFSTLQPAAEEKPLRRVTRTQTDKRVHWFRVLNDLTRAGHCRSTVSASTGISRDKLDRYYSHGTEPRYCDGEALITFWCLATGKPRSSLPKISRYDYRF